MGFWTNAHGTIAGKFDSPMTENVALGYLKSIIGKELIWGESSDEEWTFAFKHEDLYLPLGSEGSLRANYSYDSSTGEYEIKISGNLRDVYGTDWLIDWFKDISEKLHPTLIRVKVSTDDGSDIQKWKRVSPCNRTKILKEEYR